MDERMKRLEEIQIVKKNVHIATQPLLLVVFSDTIEEAMKAITTTLAVAMTQLSKFYMDATLDLQLH